MTIWSRGSGVCDRASCRSVHHGLTSSSAAGDACASRDGGHGAGPVSTGSDARHIALARPHEPRPLVPGSRPPRVERRARRGQVGRQVEARPVREAVARHRLDREQLEHLAERRARLREQRLEHPRHRQQRRAGVPRVPARRHAPALPAGGGARLEHADGVAPRGEPDRGREPAHPRADHDHPHRSRRQSAGAANAPIAAAPAAATRGRRHSAALANVSPAQVHA